MPRVTHTAQVLKGAYGDYSSVNSADYTYTAADVTNKEQTKITGQEILLARNVNGAAAHTITINSVNTPFGRKGDVTAYSLGANEFAMFGPFEITGWIQTDGNLYFEADNANIQFAVIKLP